MQEGYVAEHIHQALASDPRVNEPELRVQVVAGRAIITGDVPTDARKAAIVDVVRDVHPELWVDNQTNVIEAIPERRPSVEHIDEGLG